MLNPNSLLPLPRRLTRRLIASGVNGVPRSLANTNDDFGAWSRDLNLTRAVVVFPRELGWPLDAVRHMVPVFRPGYPWEKEFLTALGEGVSTVNLWALDHVCLYGLPLRAELGHGSAKRQG